MPTQDEISVEQAFLDALPVKVAELMQRMVPLQDTFAVPMSRQLWLPGLDASDLPAPLQCLFAHFAAYSEACTPGKVVVRVRAPLSSGSGRGAIARQPVLDLEVHCGSGAGGVGTVAAAKKRNLVLRFDVAHVGGVALPTVEVMRGWSRCVRAVWTRLTKEKLQARRRVSGPTACR